jgi:glycerol-3-phosphate acyltransferase PlsY
LYHWKRDRISSGNIVSISDLLVSIFVKFREGGAIKVNGSLDYISSIILIIVILILFFLLLKWCCDDARLRGKSPVFVCIAVIFFFPWGLIAWMLFRPKPIKPEENKFDLRDYRQQ